MSIAEREIKHLRNERSELVQHVRALKGDIIEFKSNLRYLDLNWHYCHEWDGIIVLHDSLEWGDNPDKCRCGLERK